MQAVEFAVIAAAGLGSRLGHGLPKCMLEIGGKTILTRLIESIQPYVSRIHVVVGYREELVINLCENLHRNVVIVRNPEFRTTNTVQSMDLGARGLSGKTVFLDGDLIIDPSSVKEFLKSAARHKTLVGITTCHSENPVGVVLHMVDAPVNESVVCEFSRDLGHKYEWANVVAGDSNMLKDAKGYVYERLEKYTPLPVAELNLREVDTVRDLEIAREFAKIIDNRDFNG